MGLDLPGGEIAYIKLPPPEPQIDSTKNNSEHLIFRAVEQEAVFIGGQEALNQYFEIHLEYPEKAMEADMEGVVILEIVVTKNGAIMEAKVKQSAGKEFDAEAIRLVRKMPKWRPGKQNGQAVNSITTVRVPFEI